jgi:hypothetical protein
MGPVESLHELVVQRLDDRSDRFRLEAVGLAGDLGDPYSGDSLDLDVVGRHGALLLDESEPRLDLAQPGRIGVDPRLQVGPPQPQHAAQLVGGDLVVEDRTHLLEREPEILERDDPVEPGQLAGGVRAIAGDGIDVRGREQPDRVVVTQHPDRHPAVTGEVSDTEHDASGSTASHGVRVNPIGATR